MLKPLRVASAVASVLRIFSFLLLVPIGIALMYEPWDTGLFGFDLPRNVYVFVASFLITTSFWAPTQWFSRHIENEDLHEIEAYLTVGVGWLVLVVFGTLPFLLSGMISSPIDAFFESMSGLTATGATILSGELEAIDKSLMFWRAGMQFMGGMGIIVLSVALLSRLTHGGQELLVAESPGPTLTRIRPKLAETAKSLWALYGLFSLAAFALLTIVMRFDVGMVWSEAIYDGIVHTFTMMSTAGFSNHTASIAFYDSWILELIIIFFVLVAGTNFSLHYFALHGDWRRLINDSEWRMFMAVIVGTTLTTTGLVWHAGSGFVESLRGSAFTVASIGTSLGYVTVDFDDWPDAARMLLVVLMFTGASAGSTSGGMKILRVLLLFKMVGRQMRKLRHPRAVIPIRLGRQVVKEDALFTVVTFLFTLVTLWLVASIILMGTDPQLDKLDGAIAAASALGNTGPAMGTVGPTDHFGDLLPSSKVILSLLMWVGRLEIFAALMVLFPSSWRS